MRRAGYTLVEILIVLTVMAIVFSGGYAGYREFSRRQNLAGVAKSIIGDLRYTQTLAISGKKPAGCISYLDGYEFYVVNSMRYEIRAKCSGSPAGKVVDLPSGYSISSPSPNPILFKVLGQGTNIPNGSFATLIVTQSVTSKTFAISISYGGEIK